ncbi:Dynein regulatory complex subunit 7 [Channa argus]|uniref:Dynein regulatory complex subunit 7 n=1 Tax=Channa argus TaxID=215402 RepID=A0A6G1PGI9_CHAAH|nr:Dynein regulatory complex subunit 7 [Channa argus]
METVLESDSEEQHKSEDKREEEDGQLKQSLSNVNVSAADELLWDQDKVENLCPETYRINSPDEIRLMAIADNFQCQYLHLYPERKPLLLCPVNECGVKPRYLFSSTSVLLSQKATCFEYATLLCSLLLGTHYDAYCVSGYAVKEMCLLDQSLQECPLQDTNVKSVISKQEQQENKYTVKPPKELESCFLMEQEKKKREAEAALLQKQKQQEESEQRPADPLRGLRVHCWVLVLSGSRSIQENFFIDPLTGNRYSTADDNFLGIESVWNNLNYYVNVQDCSNSCAEEEEEPQVFEMPRSWVNYIKITKKDLETRWPGGQKVTCYRKAKLENFAPYLKLDGLVKQLTTYKDLAFYRYKTLTSDFQYEMEFSSTRVDDLVRRVVSPGEMTEIFEGRSDFLYYRHVVFNRHVQFSESYQDNEDVNKHFIQKVVENFHRNKAKPANQDVAKRVFLLTKRQIEITYHLEDHRFIPSRRSFIKPQDSTEQQKAEDFTSDMVSSFQVDPSEKSLKTMTLYKMLQALVKDEENVIFQIQGSKKEVGEIVACREEEERDVQLLFSPWTTAGAARACEQREKMQRLALEEQRWLEEQEKDILAAFLIRMDNKVTFSTEDAKKLHQDCLAEYKQLLVEQANLIQERYEKETQELQKKQQWYQKNQLNMSRAEEKEYQTYCSEKTLQIHVAKKRLRMYSTHTRTHTFSNSFEENTENRFNF